MKKENLMKVAVAVALLFAVNMEADAQFGNLLNKAKKVVKEKAEKVMDGSSTSSITSSSSVKDEQGRKAVSHSWAQDYQGGKYGSLRHFGVGAEGAFYVK